MAGAAEAAAAAEVAAAAEAAAVVAEVAATEKAVAARSIPLHPPSRVVAVAPFSAESPTVPDTAALAVGSRSTPPSTAAAAQPAAAAAAAAAGRSSAGGGELFQIWEVFHEATWSGWLALCVRQAFGRGRRAGNPYADAITELRN